jgi:hypothetical protein
MRPFAFLARKRSARHPDQYKELVLRHLYALLRLYPGGPEAIVKDFPGVSEVIPVSLSQGCTPQYAAVYMAGSILAKKVEPLTPDERAYISSQLQRIDLQTLRAATRDVMAGKSGPIEIALGTLVFGNAIVTATTLFDNSEIDQSAFDEFASEISGALAGKNFEQRSFEKVSGAIDGLENVLHSISQP